MAEQVDQSPGAVVPAGETPPPSAGEARGSDAVESVLGSGDAAPQGGDDSKAGEAKAQEPAPEIDAWEPKLPEGVSVDKETVEAFQAIRKEAKLGGEASQKLVELVLARDQRAEAARAKQYEEFITTERRNDLQALKADKEFGGTNFERTVQNARKAALAYFPKEFEQELRERFADNWPALVKGLAKIGEGMAEDSIAGTTQAAPAGTSDRALYDALFPATFKKG